MRVVVLGAGVVGVAAAYYLAEDGHDVTVIDRNAEAAGETSYGNAGLFTPGDSYAWASPAALKMAVKSLYRRDLGIKMTPRLEPRLWAWSWKFLFECTNERARINTLRKLRLTMYSRQCLQALIERTKVDFDRGNRGVVYFFRSQESLDHGVQHMRLLADNGLSIEVVDRSGLAQAEPALAAAKDKLAGGIFSPMDQTGDSRKFAGNLVRWCEKERNARFTWRTNITGIEAAGQRLARVLTDKGAITADAFVLAMGCDSPLLAEQIGVALPIYPVKGYSVTIPV